MTLTLSKSLNVLLLGFRIDEQFVGSAAPGLSRSPWKIPRLRAKKVDFWRVKEKSLQTESQRNQILELIKHKCETWHLVKKSMDYSCLIC